MFLRILKKDLKRKRTMNMILLLFVVLCTVFAAAGMKNIIAVTSGLNYYFDKAGMADYYVISRNIGGEDEAGVLLEKNRNVKECHSEQVIFASSDSVSTDGENEMQFGVSLLCDISDCKLSFFDMQDRIINDIEKGTVYLTGGLPLRDSVEAGQHFTVRLGDTELTLKVAGFAKDALLGSEMMGNPRFLLNSEDFRTLYEDDTVRKYSIGHVFYISTDDADALESELTDAAGIMLSCDNSMIRTSYIMYMLVAVIVLIISIGLMIVAFVVLRFTIGFTIAEEFREIGVMKAVGLPNGMIRSLYLVKYLGIAVIGALIGFFVSIPFSRLLMKSVSSNMMLGSEHGTAIGLLCCAAVVLMILLFSWGSTRKIRKLSPIDAVRSGQTGERFRRHSLLRLGRSRLGCTNFLALNDVLSEIRQYGVLTLIFTICASLVMVLAVTADTLRSKSILYLFSVTESDAYLSDSGRFMDIMAGMKTIPEANKEIETILSENGMPASVYMEGWYKLPISANGKRIQICFMKCSDTKTTDYEYTAGSAPLSPDEIAVTDIVAEKLNVGIGDHVTAKIEGEQREFLITALFQTLDNFGACARLHEDVSIPDYLVSSTAAFQIIFDDEPDSAVISERIETLRDILDTKDVLDTEGYVKDITGVGETIKTAKNLVLILTLIIIVLLSVLMERSFISKEKTGIALMKATGFSSSSVILHHTLRFGIISLASIVLSAALFLPLTKLVIDPIFGIMGATGHIRYLIKAREIFGLYPAVIVAVTVLSAAATALYTKKIKACDTASIE